MMMNSKYLFWLPLSVSINPLHHHYKLPTATAGHNFIVHLHSALQIERNSTDFRLILGIIRVVQRGRGGNLENREAQKSRLCGCSFRQKEEAAKLMMKLLHLGDRDD
jgi:hypothetical protein